jgi:hypothetical protein
MRLKLVICIRWIATIGILLTLAFADATLMGQHRSQPLAAALIGAMAGLAGILVVPIRSRPGVTAGMMVLRGAIQGGIAGVIVIAAAMVIYTYRG